MRKPRTEVEHEGGELNVVPYLDILMNLILFMLLSMAGLATTGIAKAEAPRAPVGGAVGARLTVSISGEGFVIEGDGVEPVRIAAHDYQSLTSSLSGLKREGQSLSLRAEPGVDYETVIATLDAARETPERRALFPDVTLVF
ncbi:MAG: biopolymer transporter ExbD [Archangium sp.]